MEAQTTTWVAAGFTQSRSMVSVGGASRGEGLRLRGEMGGEMGGVLGHGWRIGWSHGGDMGGEARWRHGWDIGGEWVGP